MSLRVHLPHDFGLAALTLGASFSLPDALRMELAYRKLSQREIAETIGVPHTTLGNYLRGEREFATPVLDSLLQHLRRLGPFGVPALGEVGVIPTLDVLPGIPRGAPSPQGFPRTYGNSWIDTVHVNVDVPRSWQSHVIERLKAHHSRVGFKHPASRRGDHDAYRLSPSDQPEAGSTKAMPIVSHRATGRAEKDWLRVQFKLTDEEQRQAYHRLVDPLLFRRPPGTARLRRIDFCVDYPVEPMWLIAKRSRARAYEWITSSEGGHSTGYGRRAGPGVFTRIYDAARRHGLPTPLTRIEAEVIPARALTWADLEKEFQNPFTRLFVGSLTAASLTEGEVLILQQARVSGLTAFRKALNGRLRRELDAAVRKLHDAPRLRPDEDLETKWVLMREVLRGVLTGL